MGTNDSEKEPKKQKTIKQQTSSVKEASPSKANTNHDVSSPRSDRRPQWAKDLPTGEYTHLAAYAGVIERVEKIERQIETLEREGKDAMPILRPNRRPGQTKHMSADELREEANTLRPYAARMRNELLREESPESLRNALPLAEKSIRERVYRQAVAKPRNDSRRLYAQFMSGYSTPRTTKN